MVVKLTVDYWSAELVVDVANAIAADIDRLTTGHDGGLSMLPDDYLAAYDVLREQYRALYNEADGRGVAHKVSPVPSMADMR